MPSRGDALRTAASVSYDDGKEKRVPAKSANLDLDVFFLLVSIDQFVNTTVAAGRDQYHRPVDSFILHSPDPDGTNSHCSVNSDSKSTITVVCKEQNVSQW